MADRSPVGSVVGDFPVAALRRRVQAAEPKPCRTCWGADSWRPNDWHALADSSRESILESIPESVSIVYLSLKFKI